VPISRPLSVDGFRAGLSLPPGGMFGGTPLAGSLAIGYVVHLAQRWTPLGLALGELVYSLPLAPGEQQQVAVVERTASSTVIDSETLETTEAQSFSELDDSSTDATFRSAFNEAASGSTAMQTPAESSSTAGVGGIGLAAGPIVIGGGVATSTGNSSTSGSTSTLMEGARSTTSDSAETTHAAVQRQASARRQAARTGMRLATASETDRVVTKVITNHNKTRALTVQYWEVLRLFDVTTTVEGTSLVCLVPMDLVRFLPPGEPPALLTPPADRPAVLRRYAELIGHADVLARTVPGRYRQGLTLITEFAGDPQAAVQGSGGDAEDVLDLSLSGRFLPFEDVFVTVVSKRGLRTPPTLLTGPLDPLPTGMDAYATESELLQDLRGRRSSTGTTTTLMGSVVLPRSIPRQEVVGFEISRRFRTLDYPFIPVSLRNFILYSEAAAPDADLSSAFASAADQDAVQHSYSPDELESLLGGPPVTAFSALAGTAAFAQTVFPGAPLVLPRTPYPVSSQVIPPVLGYTSVLEIEKTLQWCIRNTMTCSVAVYSSLTAEERAVLLERYEVTLPPDENGNPQAVPLLSCITNTLLGYFGNCMVLPFQIPFAATAMTTKTDSDGHVIRRGLTTADVTDALTRFHTDGFAPPRLTIALPTKGVLGEAVLGHCPSAEKIDLTRFWNWQDSAADSATAIGGVSLPQDSLTKDLQAPDKLTGMTPVINNFSTTAATPSSALAEALGTAAGQADGFDAATLTNATNLLTQTGQTLDTAESARTDALMQAADVATKAMDAAVSLVTGTKKTEDAAKPAEPTTDAGTLSVYFAANSSTVEDAPAGTSATGQLAAITAWAGKAKAAKATAVTVKGFAATDDDTAHADELETGRANAVKAKLDEAGVSGVTAERGGLLTGEAAKCRRADATVPKAS
jgi:outer membrane protein OmpA-like peptidoglycan-associated protein